MIWETEIKTLVLFGILNNKDSDPIIVLKTAAQKDPELLLSLLIEAFNNNASSMVIPGLAAFMCSSDPLIITNEINNQIFELLISYQADDLLLLTELIKSKIFGRGLGSKTQKLIKRVLESWSETDLKDNIILNSKAVYALVRLIHPKFKGLKGTIIQDLLN